MPRISVFFKLLLLVVLFNACKSQRGITTSTPKSPDKDSTSVSDKFLEPDSLVRLQDTTRVIKSDTLVEVSDSVKQIKAEADTITIIGVGDIMLGTNYPDPKYLPPNMGKDLLAGVKDILLDADLTFGNHEGVILNEGGHPKYCKNPDICYLFRSPEYLAGHLIDAGFDVLSLANNHAGDFGDIGRQNTMKVLDSLGIFYAGLLTKPSVSFELGGIRYGFVAFAPNTGTVSIHDLKGAREIVQQLDSLNDIVIVSFHGGAEGKAHEHVTRKTEMFYGENRGNVYEFSHMLIDAGADIVFGHGPHVTRSVEVYKKRFIAYSLGNFCTYGRFNLSGPNGIAPIIKLFVNRNGEMYFGEIISVKQEGSGITVIDPDKKVVKKLQELTKTDFPESEIYIEDMGIIKYIQREN